LAFKNAMAARDVHSQCRKQGCAQCMQQRFVPRPSISDAVSVDLITPQFNNHICDTSGQYPS
jgi:hypothetical protein